MSADSVKSGYGKRPRTTSHRKHGKCRSCRQKDVCLVFLPCGHVVCCDDFGAALNTCVKIARFRDSTMNRSTGRYQSYECEDVGGILSDFMNAKLQEPYTHGNVECIELTLRQKMLLLHQPPTSKPQHRRLWNTEDRLDTLMAATDNIADIPAAGLATIAQAGFFHSGTDNTLTCFFCGCHAHGWSVDDDPWRRHAELQMTCPVLCRNVYTQIKDGSIAYRPRTRHFSDSGASSPPASYTRTLH